MTYVILYVYMHAVSFSWSGDVPCLVPSELDWNKGEAPGILSTQCKTLLYVYSSFTMNIIGRRDTQRLNS